MKYALIVAGLLASTSAFATNPNQGQNQGQQQGQSQGQFQGQAQGQLQGQSLSNRNRNSAKQSQSSSNTIEGDNNPRQAPGFAAPSLSASSEACMGSTSTGAGVSAGAVGISAVFGTTWKAEDCERRMYAQQLRLAGNNAAAMALMAMNPEVAQALRIAGYKGPLPGDSAAVSAPTSLVQASDKHPACAAGSWATKDWREANCK